MSGTRPKVSVIVPIYGVEKFIGRCARNLFGQTLQDIEYIFVDDCTKDRSMDILESVIKEYPQRAGQIIILHHDVNKGLPAARKTGLDRATGEYIAHCDSDDWTDTDMYRRMYEKAEEEDADIVVCDYFISDNGRLSYRKAFNDGLTKRDTLIGMMSQEIPWNLWTKLVRRSLYSHPDLRIPEYTQGEDMALYFQLFYFSGKISHLPEALYYYAYNTGTAIHAATPETVTRRYRQALSNLGLVQDFFSTHRDYSDITDDLIYLKLSQRELLLPLMRDRKYYLMWKNTFPEINRKIWSSRIIKFRHKVKFTLLYTRLLRS